MTGPEASADDLRFMAQALALAGRGRGGTTPNPMVGCVLVRDGAVVGEGWHARAGGPHAEVVALGHAGGAARGATAYVTLEPCCHTGRTGPCSEALIAAGVARVVVGRRDPNPRVDGGGLAALAAAGIATTTGVLEAECAELNRAFERWITTGLPWVTLKLATSLDGRIARAPGPGHAVTGPEAHAAVHALRAACDAVVVGSETALADDPRLTVRGDFPGTLPPLRVVFDSRLKVPRSARMYAVDPEAGAAVAVCALPDDHPRVAALREAGVIVLSAPDPAGVGGSPRVSVEAALRALGALVGPGGTRSCGALVGPGGTRSCGALFGPSSGSAPGSSGPSSGSAPGSSGASSGLAAPVPAGPVTSLLLEGGGGLAASFLAADRVDEVVLHQAPDFYGADGVAACAPLPVARRGVLPLGRFERHALRPLGRDLEIVFRRLSQ